MLPHVKEYSSPHAYQFYSSFRESLYIHIYYCICIMRFTSAYDSLALLSYFRLESRRSCRQMRMLGRSLRLCRFQFVSKIQEYSFNFICYFDRFGNTNLLLSESSLNAFPAKALELFLQDLCDQTYEITLQRGAKTINSMHL